MEKTPAATMAELVETGEQHDVLGRKMTPRSRRAELLAEFRRSGLTQTAFARREGLRYSTFCTWAQAERAAGRLLVAPPGGPRVKSAAAKKPVIKFVEAFAPAQASAPAVGSPFAGASATGLAVRLPDGTELRGGSALELAALVRALRD